VVNGVTNAVVVFLVVDELLESVVLNVVVLDVLKNVVQDVVNDVDVLRLVERETLKNVVVFFEVFTKKLALVVVLKLCEVSRVVLKKD